MKTLNDVVRDLYGVNVFPNINPLVSSLSTTSQKIADNNNNRFQLIITNNGAVTIYIGLDSTVSANKGISLAAGGTLVFKFKDDLNLVGWEFWAVAASGTPNITVIETIGYKDFGQPTAQ